MVVFQYYCLRTIKNLILKKKLKVNNKILTDPTKKVLHGEKIILDIPEPERSSLKPYNFKDTTNNNYAIFNEPHGTTEGISDGQPMKGDAFALLSFALLIL